MTKDAEVWSATFLRRLSDVQVGQQHRHAQIDDLVYQRRPSLHTIRNSDRAGRRTPD